MRITEKQLRNLVRRRLIEQHRAGGKRTDRWDHKKSGPHGKFIMEDEPVEEQGGPATLAAEEIEEISEKQAGTDFSNWTGSVIATVTDSLKGALDDDPLTVGSMALHEPEYRKKFTKKFPELDFEGKPTGNFVHSLAIKYTFTIDLEAFEPQYEVDLRGQAEIDRWQTIPLRSPGIKPESGLPPEVKPINDLVKENLSTSDGEGLPVLALKFWKNVKNWSTLGPIEIIIPVPTVAAETHYDADEPEIDWQD